MTEVLDRKIRVAKKEHTCSYCRGIIHKGERYDWSKMKYERELYEWKAHMDCMMVANEIWSYVEPDEGMTEEDFEEGVRDVCSTFICPGCPRNPENNGEEECDKYYCLEKVVDLLKENELQEEHKGPWRTEWKLVPREKKEELKQEGK